MTISSVVQNGFFQDGNQIIRIPPRSAEKVNVARRRARLARAKSTKRTNSRSPLLWTAEEHERFLAALEMYPSGPWKVIANYVGTRSTRQTMTHAQKYRQKIERRKQKQFTWCMNASVNMAQLDALLPRSPTTVDNTYFSLQNDMPTASMSDTQSVGSNNLSVVIDDDVERALTMDFLDEFQPLTMECEESLTTFDGVASDDPFWLDIGAVSDSIAAAEAAVWEDSEIFSL